MEDLKKEIKDRDEKYNSIIDRLEKDYMYMMEKLLKK